MSDRKLIAFLSSRQSELMVYRDAAERAVKRYDALIDLWRFENVPATAEVPEQVYLAGVKASDVVLFIAGREASEATAAEIVEAASSGKDILAFLLPETSREPQVQELIERVRGCATTKDVSPDVPSFEEEVAEAVRVWIIGRRRDEVTPQRLQRLEALRSASRERAILKWQASALNRGIAEQLEGDSDVGRPSSEIIPSPTQPIIILVGPAGSGKSLLAERIHQDDIERARSALAPVPVYARASEVTGGLREYVDRHVQQFGDLHLTGFSLVVDGLDEISEELARRLQDDAVVLARAFPLSRVTLTSRHPPPDHLSEYVRHVPPISDQDLEALVRRLRGEIIPAWQLVHGLPESLREAVHRPLFAIAFILRSQSTSSVADLMHYLIDQCLARTERAHATSEMLQNLAVRVLDSEIGLVSEQHIPVSDQDALLRTRLVYERDRRFGFTLRLVAEYAAAGALQRQSLEEAAARAKGPKLAARWETVFSIYLDSLSDAAARSFVNLIAAEHPRLAHDLAKNDKRLAYTDWEGNEFGAAMRAAMSAYGAALPRLVPQRVDGRPPNTLAAIAKGWLYTGWRDTPDEADITTAPPPTMFTASWWFQRAARLEQLRFEPHLVVQEALKGVIDRRIVERGFSVEYGPLLGEDVWEAATALLKRGELDHSPISLDLVEQRARELPSGRVRLLNHYRRPVFDADYLKRAIHSLREQGKQLLEPAFVTRDASDGGWVWSGYSPDAIVRRRSSVLQQAMNLYQLIVDEWFGKLAQSLSKRILMPAVIHERIYYTHHDMPVASTYWEPLERGSSNQVDVALGSRYDFASVVAEVRPRLSTLRPPYAGQLGISLSEGELAIWGIRPVRDTAYRWLVEDLHNIGWTSHFSLPSDRA